MQRNVPVTPIQLDSSIAIKISMGGSMFQERALMGRSDIWHKIKIVRGAQYDKEVVLRAILAAVEPADLIPVKYQINGEDSFFIARNCRPALDKLCKSNLIIKNTAGDPLILIVTLGYASIHDLKVNIQPLMLAALTRRYDQNTKSLNLEEFHRDPEISKTVYCPLSQQRTFNHLLKLATTTVATVEHLNLQNNGLFHLPAMQNFPLTSVKYLDLRHNNLMNMNALTVFKNLSVRKLWLDGNPLCENYSSARGYIDSARRYCPNLIQLDGVYISEPDLPLTYTSYFTNECRKQLVNKFVFHFFNLYDQKDRTILRGLYHKNAFYSMSLGIPHAVAHKRNLTQFTSSRNLLRTTDSLKRSQHLYQGQDSVFAGMKKLPRCCHVKTSFLCDLMYDDGKCLVISVTGLMKKLDGIPQVLSFNRTFVLLAGPENEYNIVNDQYHVDSAPEEVALDSLDTKPPYEDFETTCFSSSEKNDMSTKFKEITSLNEKWSLIYLNEAKWNFRKAISNFMKDYKSAAVPQEAFGR